MHYKSLNEIGELIANGEISSVAVTQKLIQRIQHLDNDLHSFQQTFYKKALSDAELLDKELAQGKRRSKLHGVPIAVKDILSLKGEVRGAGTSVLKEQGKQIKDAEVIKRLKDSGAVIVGTLALTEGALTTYHPTVIMPVNPWSSDRWSGVSSSGCGVAVASGLCYAALGTDTGGSIRFPAAVNGIVGLKPTFASVPNDGCFPLSPSMDHIGPMTRTVEDAALILSIISQKNYTISDKENLNGVRIGFDKNYCCNGTEPEITQTILNSLDTFIEAGAEVIDIIMPDWDKVENSWFPLCASEAYQVHKETFERRQESYGLELKETLIRASTLPPALIDGFKDIGKIFTNSLSSVLNDVDVIFTPTLGIQTPPSIREPDQTFPTMMRFTAPFNISGHPTLSMPCGFSSDDMPSSLQLIAGKNNEQILIDIGIVYQRLTSWHHKHPIA